MRSTPTSSDTTEKLGSAGIKTVAFRKKKGNPMDNKFRLDKINGGRYGMVLRTDGSLELKRSGREWIFFWQGVKAPLDLREALADMAEELHDLRKLRDAVLLLSVCDYPFGRLVGFGERADAEDEHEIAYEFLASVIEPIVQNEDGEENLARFKWVRDEEE